MERRRASRHPASEPTIASTGFARMPSLIDDVSRTGCRLKTPARLRLGERVGIELPAPDDQTEFLTGYIVWSGPKAAGMAFDSPLETDVMTRLIGDAEEDSLVSCEVVRLEDVRAGRAQPR